MHATIHRITGARVTCGERQPGSGASQHPTFHPHPPTHLPCSYLAPELLKTRLTGLDKADMFALGATVYELATAHTLPSEGERWVALWEGKLMMLPAVSQQLAALIKVRGGE